MKDDGPSASNFFHGGDGFLDCLAEGESSNLRFLLVEEGEAGISEGSLVPLEAWWVVPFCEGTGTESNV